jgi:hypothetical protein
MNILFFTLSILISLCTFSQIKNGKRKVSNEKGTIFISWGYNRSAYTKSNLRLQGQGYNFDLQYCKARDNQSSLNSGDYTLKSLSVPQYNFKIGYYYKQKWSISLGVDHMKYVFLDNNQVVLSGNLSFQDKNVVIGDNINYGGLKLLSKNITTDRDVFHFENSKGLNYIHGELGLTEKIYVAGKKGQFVVSTNLGIGAGCLLSYTNLLFNGIQNPTTRSLSGYGLSTYAGLRFEFLKRIYLYSNFSVGFLHKIHEKTSIVDQVAYASQHFGYSQIEAGLGFFIFKKPKNACDDCPIW